MEETHPGITPMNSQCCISEVNHCESLLHRIRTIQGRTNLNLTEPHFAGDNAEKQLRTPAVTGFKKRIKHQQEILEKCKRKVADQLDQLYSARKSQKTKTVDFYETGDHTEVNADNQVKLSQLYPNELKRKQKRKISAEGTCARSVKKSKKIINTENNKVTEAKQEDAPFAQSQAVTSLKIVQKTANTEEAEEVVKINKKKKKHRAQAALNLNQLEEEANKKEMEPEIKPNHSGLVPSESTEFSKESRLKNIVNSAIARLNEAKSSVQKVMKDNAENVELLPNSNAQNEIIVMTDPNLQVTTRPKTKRPKRLQPSTEEKQKPLHGILKGISTSCMSTSRKLEHTIVLQQDAVSNSVMKEINLAKKIARAQSAKLTPKPQRALKKQNKSTGCLLKKSVPELRKALDVKVETDGEVNKDPSGKDVCKKVTQNTNKTLSILNEQMSSTLQESIAHLNDLYLRVRNCLTDIETDELNYQKEKSKQKQIRIPPSECVGDSKNIVKYFTSINEEEPSQICQVEELQCIPNSDQSFQITKAPSVLTTIEQVITAISLGNGEIKMDLPKLEAPPPLLTANSQETEPEEVNLKKKKSIKKRKRRGRKQSNSLTKLPSMEKIDCNASQISNSKLPIWQRQLPSIIEEIQQTVKKQATRTQYREFLKTLKHLARRDKFVLPRHTEKGNDHQTRTPSPLKGEKTQPNLQKQVYQRLKDVKNVLEVTGLSEAKKSKPCTQCALDKCTCGVKVENLCPADSLSTKQKLQWIRTRSDLGNNSFQAYDILDEITLKDVEPIQSEYPRKDHLPSAASMKKVEDTLLYKLVYNRNPKFLSNFLQSTSFIDDALMQKRKHMEKSTSERHVTINKVEQKLRPKSASNAYRLYEKFEFDREIPPEKLIMSDLSKEIQVVKAPKSKPKSLPKKIDNFCSLQSIKSKNVKWRPEKTAEEKLRLINKCSAKSLKKGKRDLIKTKLRPLLQDPNFKMKKILTIMPNLIDQRQHITKTAKEAIKAKLRPYMVDPNKLFAVYPLQVECHSQKTNAKQKLVKNMIEACHQGALETAAKRDVIEKLKPYIFMNFSFTEVNSKANLKEASSNLDNPKKVLAVYPVQVRYEYQKTNRKQKTLKISKNTSELELHRGTLEPTAKKDVRLETMAAKTNVVFEVNHEEELESSKKRDVISEEALEPTANRLLELSSLEASQKGVLESMTKRDVIKKLKPYIFMDLSPAEVTVMPVSAKYNAKLQNSNEPHHPRVGHKTSENIFSKPLTSKKTPWFPKDHGDDCYTGKKPCKKCQMHVGVEPAKYAKDFTVVTHMVPNYLPNKLGECRQYWSNNRKLSGEHMVSVVFKNTNDIKPTKTKPNTRSTKQEVTSKEVYKIAANTRNKLKEAKKTVKKNDLISQNLQGIIDTFEFKIVDVLSNQKKDCSGALRDIEEDIKSVLEMVSPKPSSKPLPNNSKGKNKLTTQKFEKSLPLHEKASIKNSAFKSTPLTAKIDDAHLNLERKTKNEDVDSKMICIYAKVPPENSSQMTLKKELETTKEENETVGSEQEDADLKNIEKAISEFKSLIHASHMEVPSKELIENLEKPTSDFNNEDVATKDVESLEMSLTDSQVQSIVDDYSTKENADLKSAEEDLIVDEVRKYNCENMVTNFCKQVDTVIKKITMSEESLVQKQQDENEVIAVKDDFEGTVQTDKYLTPYMRIIKDYRRSANQTQSFMDFLDELSRLSQEKIATCYNCKYTMNRALTDNMTVTKEVIQRLDVKNILVHSPSYSEKKHAKKKMKNRKLQTRLSNHLEKYEFEASNKNQDVQTEGKYIEEEDNECFESPKYAEIIQNEVINRGTQHESNPLQSQLFTWSLLSESTPCLNTQSAEVKLPQIPELIETATEVDLSENTKNKDTQIPGEWNHQCFTSSEDQVIQVTDDLKQLCMQTIESQVSELHFKTPSHSVSIGTELKLCDLDKKCSNFSTVTSHGSYDQIKDFICIKSKLKLIEPHQQMEKVSLKTLPKNCSKDVHTDLSTSMVTDLGSEDPKNNEVISIFECKNSLSSITKAINHFESKHKNEMLTTHDRISFGINTSGVLVGDAKLHNCLDNLCLVKDKADLEIAEAHKRLLGTVYGIVFIVIFLGLNLQYSC